MTGETWLYLYEDRSEKRLYVGIADRLDRVWGPHNADAETVRDAPGSQILQTVEPFSSRDDALKAEAVAIHVAMLSGVAVYHAEGGVSVSDGQVRVANRAGVGSIGTWARCQAKGLSASTVCPDGDRHDLSRPHG